MSKRNRNRRKKKPANSRQATPPVAEDLKAEVVESAKTDEAKAENTAEDNNENTDAIVEAVETDDANVENAIEDNTSLANKVTLEDSEESTKETAAGKKKPTAKTAHKNGKNGSASKEWLIDAKGLERTYYRGVTPVRALQGVDIRIEKGEFLAIMGPSGSGKSTMMNLLGCLDKPTGGEYLFDNVEIGKLDDAELSHFRNRRVGFIFQSFNLINQLTVTENVELPLMYAGVKREERRERAIDILHRVKLGHRLDHYPNELSGGENQRVATARALVVGPDIILADEPTGNLDTKTGEEIMELIAELHKQGVSIVLVTHDVWVANWADRIIQMKDGKVLQEFRQRITADMLQL